MIVYQFWKTVWILFIYFDLLLMWESQSGLHILVWCHCWSVFVAVQRLSFGKIGFSKAMSNKWIRLDKAHESGPRIFRNVCGKLSLKLLRPFFSFNVVLLSYCFKTRCLCVVMYPFPGGEHRRPGQREAASGEKWQRDSAGGEGKEWAEEEKTAGWSVRPQPFLHKWWWCAFVRQ